MERLAIVTLNTVIILGLVASGLRAQSAGSSSGPAAPSPGTSEGSDRPPTCKICMRESKTKTRKVYRCRIEEYCLPHWSLRALWCGPGSGAPDCELKIRHRLVVKKVPDGTTCQCVPRALPAAPGAGPK